jgi:hypothetical protein
MQWRDDTTLFIVRSAATSRPLTGVGACASAKRSVPCGTPLCRSHVRFRQVQTFGRFLEACGGRRPCTDETIALIWEQVVFLGLPIPPLTDRETSQIR